MRGICSLYILAFLMEEIKLYDRQDGHTRRSASAKMLLDHRWREDTSDIFLPCHYFDFISGTSTGGFVASFFFPINKAKRTVRLVAVMLGRLRLNVDQAINNMKRIWQSMAMERNTHRKILNTNSKMANSNGMETAIKEILVNRQCDITEGPHRHIDEDLFGADPRLCRT